MSDKQFDIKPFQTIRLTKNGRMFIIQLNRPEVRNAFNPQMINEILQALELAEADPDCRLLHIRGNDQFFCSGADLAWMQQSGNAGQAANDASAKRIASLYNRLYTCTLPILTFVNGPVFGGALGFVAISDWVLADPTSRFCFSETRLGIAPAIIMPYLLQKTGNPALLQKMITAEVFDPNEALRLDIIDKIIDYNQLDDELLNFGQQLLTVSPQAVRKTKELHRSFTSEDMKKRQDMALGTLSWLKQSPQGQYGLNTFLAKEKPDWTNIFYEKE